MKVSTQARSPNFFSERSPFLNHPLLTDERTKLEVDFIQREVETNPRTRFLDVGCGFGRHSTELARRGCAVKGIDPSAAMIAEAKKRAAAAGVRVDFQQRRGEEIRDIDTYAAAICLFTSLGQISENGENSGLIDRVFRALKPGGKFMVEVPQRDTVVSQLKMNEQFGEGENMTRVSRSYDEKEQVMSEQFRVTKYGHRRSYLLMYRLFDRDELEALFMNAGFMNRAAYGDYLGTRLMSKHMIMLMVGEKGK